MGIFGISREKVKVIRRKQAKATLKRRHKEKVLGQKVEVLKAETEFYKAKAAKKQARQKASFHWPVPPIPGITVRKKKQGKKLSSKSRIRLI